MTVYERTNLQTRTLNPDEPLPPISKKDGLVWLHTSGIHNVEWLSALQSGFNIHSLVMEDVLNTEHRTKIEVSENHIFAVIKHLVLDKDTWQINVEQISLLLGDGYVLSFSENESNLFEPIVRRLQNPASRLRKNGADYLFYTLLDTVVDHYFVLFETFQEVFEELEELIAGQRETIADDIHLIKKQLSRFRRHVWPLREALTLLMREKYPFMQKGTMVFFRDLYDHILQVIDGIEYQRETASGLMDSYLTTVSNRMNEVMKVLTIIATIFIPLSFIVGLYGMNFEYMPELGWKYSYFVLLGILVLVVGGMLMFFRRKKWL